MSDEIKRGELLTDGVPAGWRGVYTGVMSDGGYCVVWVDDCTRGTIHPDDVVRLTPDEPEHVREERWRRFCR